MLNSIHDIDSSDISNISDIESHVTLYCEPSMKSVNYVNTDKQGKKTNADKSGSNTQCNGEHITAEILTKNCQKYDTKNTGKNFSKEFVLKEQEDRYDLELRFKSQNTDNVLMRQNYTYF